MSESQEWGARTLTPGKQGKDVRTLQAFLGLKQDGIYGPKTEAAVMAWQQAQGLRPDGIVGPKTYARIEAVQKEPASPQPALDPVPEAPPQFTPLPVNFIQNAFPYCQQPHVWQEAFDQAFSAFPQFNRQGKACIFGMVNSETGGLTRWDENLNYSTAEQIKKTFGSKAGKDIGPLINNPRALGDQVYADLGGYEGRGLGSIQLTGLKNQQAYADWVGMDLKGARRYLQVPMGAALAAPFYFDQIAKNTAALNRGDMLAAIAAGLGKSKSAVQEQPLWDVIRGDVRMATYHEMLTRLGG